MSTTSNAAVPADAWTLLFTATASATKFGVHNFSASALMLHVGASDPGAGDASPNGRLIVEAGTDTKPGKDGGTLDSGDKLWGRMLSSGLGAGRVTLWA